MRICTFSLGGEPRLGVLFGERIADLELAYAATLPAGDPAAALATAMREVPADCESFVADLANGKRVAAAALDGLAGLRRRRAPLVFDGMPVVFEPDAVTVHAPVSEVTLFCMARNYVAHAAEMARKELDEFKEELPLYCFFKPPTCIAGPFEPVRVTAAVKKLDYELELGVVIGRGGRHIPVARAMEHVGGYTLVNDMSDRGTLGKKGSPFIDWYHMKAGDGFAPTGPYILVAGDDVDPHGLRLRLWVNRKLRQNATTGDMVWKIPEMIAYLSRIATLRPGDIVSTGSPAGNAASWGAYLEPGDVVEGEIQHIGRQRFTIERTRARYTPG